MKKPGAPTVQEHPEELFMRYLEDRLSPVQKAQVEQHIGLCTQCSVALDEIRQTVAILRENREAFCAEPWELYEYVYYGHDPDGIISQHLKHCSACRESCEFLSIEAPSEQEVPRPAGTPRERGRYAPEAAKSWAQRLKISLSNVYPVIRLPAFAAGAVMAAVVGFVLFHPWSVPPYFVAFSSVDWKGIPKPKAAPVSEKRAGVVIVWKDFDKQPSQGEVDSLYLAVAPSMEVYERIGVVSPKALKDFAQRGGTVPGDRESLLKWLRTELDMNMVVLVTISRRGEGRSVQTELIDTASGAVLARKTEEAYAEAELPARIRESVMNLLLLAGQAGGSDGKP